MALTNTAGNKPLEALQQALLRFENRFELRLHVLNSTPDYADVHPGILCVRKGSFLRLILLRKELVRNIQRGHHGDA